MFLPSGRVHAIGVGLVIFEIQQNSDTTYRVFDWNRVGLDGKPRELHVPQSLASINFNDFEPPLVQTKFSGDENTRSRWLVQDPLFNVEIIECKKGARPHLKPMTLQILAVVTGKIDVHSGTDKVNLTAGQFCLIPAELRQTEIIAETDATLLRVEAN
jgi:mannose-6-phosphate isomerase